jgi:hypothetical protein
MTGAALEGPTVQGSTLLGLISHSGTSLIRRLPQVKTCGYSRLALSGPLIKPYLSAYEVKPTERVSAGGEPTPLSPWDS